MVVGFKEDPDAEVVQVQNDLFNEQCSAQVPGGAMQSWGAESEVSCEGGEDALQNRGKQDN